MDIIKLIQLRHATLGRRIALVDEPMVTLLDSSVTSSYDFVTEALASETAIHDFLMARLSAESMAYDPIYNGESPWQLLPAFDHPTNPFACLVSGTGLTHHSSAKSRQLMHLKNVGNLTDSMKMYQWGVEGGNPPLGSIGVQPEWFYKGNGYILKAHGEPLEVPPYADDGGEEAELAGIYLVDQAGTPVRIGFCNGNEFSDHLMESKNYLYLAPSKMRECAIGPELVMGLDFNEFRGEVSVVRQEEMMWRKPVKSGSAHMAHSLANLEYHHFKYPTHRIPGQVHVHFYGADAFSYGEQVRLAEGDKMIIHWEKLGRPLINTMKSGAKVDELVALKQIC
ncbi:AraD1 family protein [Parapedobacter deserti]|uniref:AraD1 family protein n=1 Tax=Parapedobacter deserti TaxID=1912957 RepID=A0ABV7JLW6_9SPHI